jgi:hypothetical protein
MSPCELDQLLEQRFGAGKVARGLALFLDRPSLTSERTRASKRPVNQASYTRLMKEIRH